MSHKIQIFAGPIPSIRRLCAKWASCRMFVATPHSLLAVIPLTLDDAGNLAGWGGAYRPDGHAIAFHQGDEAMARGASEGGALAYIETNYYGSNGFEAAALWIDGRLDFGPVTQWLGEAPPPVPAPVKPGRLQASRTWIKTRLGLEPEANPSAARDDGPPINRALRGLGVVKANHDEYSTFGLGGVRTNEHFAEDWIALSGADRE